MHIFFLHIVQQNVPQLVHLVGLVFKEHTWSGTALSWLLSHLFMHAAYALFFHRGIVQLIP